jgi:multisubunit Na+/H+ antiporter MnhF subunit
MPDKVEEGPFKPRRPLYGLLAFLFLLIGLASIAYTVYDLLYSNRIADSAMGIDIVTNILFISMGLLGLFGGLVFLFKSYSLKDQGLHYTGSVVVIIFALFMVAVALKAYSTRIHYERSKVLAGKSAAELLVIAEKDAHAIDTIRDRRNPADLPALLAFVMNDKVDVHLRANALKTMAVIGGKDAMAELEKIAKSNSVPAELKDIAFNLTQVPETTPGVGPKEGPHGVEDF